MAKRTIYAPTTFDNDCWIVVRYDDTKQLSDIFKSFKIETEEGATGLDHQFKEGDRCMAPWKRAGLFPAAVAIITEDKTDCLKRKLSIEANDKKKSKPKPAAAPKIQKKAQVEVAKKTSAGKKTTKSDQKKARFEATKAAAKSVSNKFQHDLVRTNTISPSSASPEVSRSSSAGPQSISDPPSPHSPGSQPISHTTSSLPPYSQGPDSSAGSNHSPPPSQGPESSAGSNPSPPPSQGPESSAGSHPSPPPSQGPESSAGSHPSPHPHSQGPHYSAGSHPSPHPHSQGPHYSAGSHPSPYPHYLAGSQHRSHPPPHSQGPDYLFGSPPRTNPPPHSQRPVSSAGYQHGSVPHFTSLQVPVSSAGSQQVLNTLQTFPHASPSNPNPNSAYPTSSQHEQISITGSCHTGVPSLSHPFPPSPTSLPQPGSFLGLLNEECPECILLRHANTNLQQQVQSLQSDLNHLREKYQQALKDGSSSERLDDSAAPDRDDLNYTPNKGLKIPKANYVIQEGLTPGSVRPGHCQFGGEGSTVMVPAKWLGLMQAKTKTASPSHSLKKYLDGFFNPWELQTVTVKAMRTMTGVRKELFDALQLFASKDLHLSSAEFHRAILTKAGTSRRTMLEVFPDQAVPKKQKFTKKNN